MRCPLNRPAPRSRVLAPVIALACLAGAARAQTVLFSNYGPGDTYSGGPISATFAGYGKSAARFVPAAGGEFDRVETSISRQGGGSGAPLTVAVSIVPDAMQAGGPPGPVPGLMPVWCASAVSAPVEGRAVYTFTGPRAALVAGQAYWIVIEATESTSWYMTQPPLVGTTATKNGSPTWFTTPSGPMPAFRISSSGATPAGHGACCNTATGGCALAAGATCAALGGSFSGVGVTCAATPSACAACPADFDRSGGVSVQDIFAFLQAYFAGCP